MRHAGRDLRASDSSGMSAARRIRTFSRAWPLTCVAAAGICPRAFGAVYEFVTNRLALRGCRLLADSRHKPGIRLSPKGKSESLKVKCERTRFGTIRRCLNCQARKIRHAANMHSCDSSVTRGLGPSLCSGRLCNLAVATTDAHGRRRASTRVRVD